VDRQPHPTRRGTVLPLLAITLVALLGFVALAIDIGLMAMARTQCQNAADCAALTGARTLSGNQSANDNFANCEPNTRAAISANQVQGVAINGSDTTNVVVNIGAYAYDPTTALFSIKIPKGSSDPYDLVQVNITVPNNATFFGRVFNVTSYSTSATATAAHRPRDVCMIQDFSGSMRFSSLLGIPYFGTRDNGTSGTTSGSNNPESIYPMFGHYSATSTAGLQFTTAVEISTQQYSPANITESDAANDNLPPVVLDFYQNTPYTNPDVPAFNNTVNSSGPNPPADSGLLADNLASGDRPLRVGNVATNAYAKTIKDITGGTTKNTSFEALSSSGGYNYYYNQQAPIPPATTPPKFSGYTQGPRYWGKTFFIWPPDPRWTSGADPTKPSLTDATTDINGKFICDWRQRFFFKGSDGVTPCNDNNLLWDSSGNWQMPSSTTYKINYKAILAWLASNGPNPFPPVLHAGHIQYYTAIPTTIDTSTFPPTNTDQRFWKEYIDDCLGLMQTGSNSWTYVGAQTGYGDDFPWTTSGNPVINAKPTTPSGSIPYMNYLDNPERPRTKFWFGPMTMVDFMGNYNLNRWYWPGDCHEAPIYACKQGIAAALADAQNNHPNDYMSLITFSVPRTSSSDTAGRFNTARVPLGTNYSLMQSALWFPLGTLDALGNDLNTMVTPYDSNNLEVPRAYGGTAYAMGLMLAFNQFQYTTQSDTVLRKWITPSSTIPEGVAGGEGRKGSQKVVIFCTDGAPNTTASATATTSGSVTYYPVRYNSANPTASEYPSTASYSDNASTVTTQINGIIDKMVTSYSTARKPFRLYAIGFGPDFLPSYSEQSTNLSTLQTMQYHAGTQSSASTALPSFQIVTGNNATMAADLTTAITTIMQGSIQVVLLQ
jgi:Flp pilus assembly protein TadG